jgi:hypothetical protein
MIPDHLFIVERVYDEDGYDLTKHADHARFVDDVVVALHAHDSAWGHLRKKPGQTNIHGHGEDSALYKLANNRAWAVDFVGGAGGPSPTLRWGPDPVAYYTHADWLDPADHAEPSPPPPVTTKRPYPGDAFFRDVLGAQLASDYAARPQPMDDGSVVWAARVIWDHVVNGMPLDQAVNKHRFGPDGWRKALGL